MRTVLSIQHIEFFKGKDGRKYSRTYALLDDGTECIGFGKQFEVGNRVEVFLHRGIIKMRLKPVKL